MIQVFNNTSLTDVLVPIHTKNGVYMGHRKKNLTPEIHNPQSHSYPNIVSSIEKLWSANNFKQNPPKILRTNVVNNSLEVVLDRSYSSITLQSRGKFPDLISKELGIKAISFKAKDGYYGITLPLNYAMPSDEKQFSRYRELVDYFGSIDYKNDYYNSPTEDTIFSKWDSTLSEHGRLSVYAYTSGGDGYSRLLGTFFRGQPRDKFDGEKQNYNTYTPEELEGIRELSKELDTAVSTFTLPQPIQVYREVNAENRNKSTGVLEKIRDCYKSNKPFVDESYCSTALIKNSFQANTSKQIHMKIHVPAGTGIGAFVSPISDFTEENEFLLARGTSFEILSLQEGVSDTYVEARVIGKQEIPWEQYLQRNKYVDMSNSTGRSVAPIDWDSLFNRLTGLDDEEDSWGDEDNWGDEEYIDEGEDTKYNPITDSYSDKYVDIENLLLDYSQDYKGTNNKAPSAEQKRQYVYNYLKSKGFEEKYITDIVNRLGDFDGSNLFF